MKQQDIDVQRMLVECDGGVFFAPDPEPEQAHPNPDEALDAVENGRGPVYA